MKARYKPPKLTRRESNALYTEAADDAARSIMAAVIYMLHLRGWHKDKICKFYDDVLSVVNMPEVFGHKLHDVEIKQFLAERYGIDFSKLELNIVFDSEHLKDALLVYLGKEEKHE